MVWRWHLTFRNEDVVDGCGLCEFVENDCRIPVYLGMGHDKIIGYEDCFFKRKDLVTARVKEWNRMRS